jgi:hypothetical protein
VDGRVLLFSMRRLADLVGYCAMYEFEDLTVDATDGDLVMPLDVARLEASRKLFKLARVLTGSTRLADAVRMAPGALEVTRSHDLFFAVFNHPHELFALHALRGWRERARFAACYLCEAWTGQLPVYLLEMLRQFDHVFVGVLSSVDAVAAVCGRPCTYLPMGVDALAFCPYPNPPARGIDVCGIGRRSAVTHDALRKWAAESGRFYYYDTIQSRGAPGANGGFTRTMTFRVSDHREHRVLLANLLKRSRYFIANRAWADNPSITRGNDEIAARFYEGAAAGTVMVGEPPDSDDFRTQFPWHDAVVRMPFDAPGAADVLAALDADPARTGRMRRDAVVHALRMHDWVYRLRQVLDTAGAPPLGRVQAREARLQDLANDVAKSS